MIYVQFFNQSVHDDSLTEAIGDRGVLVLDGRYSRRTWAKVARAECVKRRFQAFEVRKANGIHDTLYSVALPRMAA